MGWLYSARAKAIAHWLFHAYFAVGLLFLGWAPDLVLFGYFIEACVQLFFGWWILVFSPEPGKIRRIFSFSWKAVIGLVLYLIFLFIIDFAMKETYRSDTLLIKLALTLESIADPLMQGDDFLVNLFTREMRNEFVIESLIAFGLTLAYQILNFLEFRRKKILPEVSMLSLVQFWFLLGMALVMVAYFKLPISFGWFLIVTRVLFDQIATGKNEKMRMQSVKQFIYHLVILILGLLIIGSDPSMFTRIICSITLVMLLLSTSSVTLDEGAGLGFRLWEKVVFSVEAVLILIMILAPGLLPDEKKGLLSALPEKNYILCKLGRHGACAAYGEKILEEKLHWPKIQEAMEMLKKDCAQSGFESCYQLGKFQLDGIGGQKTQSGIDNLNRACDHREPWACLRLDKTDLALEIFSTECKSGKLSSCHPAGRVAESQKKNIPLALEYYKFGCDHGDAKSCNAVGFFLDTKDKSYRESAIHYLKACRGGVFTACANAAYMFREGLGVKKSTSHAQSLYHISCEVGKNGFGCYENALFLRKYGSYDKIDQYSEYEAAQKMRQACKYGYEKACR